MGNGFQFIDIVFFAMIAAFLVLRLRSVLGRRNDTKTGHRDPFAASERERANDDNVIALPDHGREPIRAVVRAIRIQRVRRDPGQEPPHLRVCLHDAPQQPRTREV